MPRRTPKPRNARDRFGVTCLLMVVVASCVAALLACPVASASVTPTSRSAAVVACGEFGVVDETSAAGGGSVANQNPADSTDPCGSTGFGSAEVEWSEAYSGSDLISVESHGSAAGAASAGYNLSFEVTSTPVSYSVTATTSDLGVALLESDTSGTVFQFGKGSPASGTLSGVLPVLPAGYRYHLEGAGSGWSFTLTLGNQLVTVTIGDVAQLEGNAGVTNFVFPVTLSTPSANTVSMGYGPHDGTATVADGDFDAASGSLNFAPGETAKQITVSVHGDTKFEPDETFSIVLASPTNATLAKGVGIGTILNDDTRVDVDWTVPDRFGRDDNGDGLIDYLTTPQAVSPPNWRVDFVYTVDGSCNPALTPSLTIDGVPVSPGSAAILLSDPSHCTISYGFPTEKKYSVKLDLHDAGGAIVGSVQRDVVVQDWLIVSIGDSVASGEGSPDIPGPTVMWENRQCHRSADAGPAQAALAIERADPKTSVTFIHLACSGASVFQGILAPYRGQEPGALLPPQVDQMAALVGNREIDALTVSAGANDVRFSTIVFGCFLETNCQLASTPNSMLTFFNGWLSLLPGNYDALGLELRQPNYGVQPNRTYITEYFDPMHNERGAYCDQTILEEAINLPIVGISAAESQWASTDMLVRLNQTVRAGAVRNGWQYVGGIYSAFQNHGYCATASARWIVQLTESLLDQHNIDGTIHPNRAGQSFYGAQLSSALTADFYTGGDLTKPRLPR